MGKLLYKPFGIIAGIIAGFVGRKLFDFVWTKIDDEEPPGPTTKEAPLPKLLTAVALQAVIFRVVRVFVDRQGARGFEYLTGIWPGERRPDPE